MMLADRDGTRNVRAMLAELEPWQLTDWIAFYERNRSANSQEANMMDPEEWEEMVRQCSG